MRTIVIQNDTNTSCHIRGLRAKDGGQETVFHVMPRTRGTLKADAFFDLNKLPRNVTLVSDSDANKAKPAPTHQRTPVHETNTHNYGKGAGSNDRSNDKQDSK